MGDIVVQAFQPAIVAVQRIGRPHSLPHKYSLNYTFIVFARSNGEKKQDLVAMSRAERGIACPI
jgi:hypothetical protein